MQTHPVARFPLESSGAIKKQSEEEIDVPWGLLPGMPRISQPRGPGGISLPAPLGEGTRSPLAPYFGVTWGHGVVMAPQLLFKRPTLPKTSHCTQGGRHPEAIAPCFLCCAFVPLFIHQAPCHSVASWM